MSGQFETAPCHICGVDVVIDKQVIRVEVGGVSVPVCPKCSQFVDAELLIESGRGPSARGSSLVFVFDPDVEDDYNDRDDASDDYVDDPDGLDDDGGLLDPAGFMYRYENEWDVTLPVTQSTSTAPSFLDFEASSFDGYPIEVAISTADGEILSWLIRPAPGWTDWSPKAETLHGISREMLVLDGTGVRDVARQLNLALADRVAYSDSPEFDGRWCRELFEAAGEEMLFSIGHAGAVIPDVPRRNAKIEREARRRAGPPHRAGRDVAFLVELYRLATAAAKGG